MRDVNMLQRSWMDKKVITIAEMTEVLQHCHEA